MKISAFLLTLFFSVVFSATGIAADLVRPSDRKDLENYASEIASEQAYRQRIDAEGARWARDLMLMYKWSLLYPMDLRSMPDTPENKAALELRMKSEFAWLTITSHGMLATYDFAHAQQGLAGSTSRFVGALMLSVQFWREVRSQCLEISELKRNSGVDPGEFKNCAERLKRDIEISQIVGSNVSLFVGGGVVLSLGKKLFQRYASQWVASRVLPLIPAFAKTKVALGVLTVGIIAVPTTLIFASVSSEQESSRAFYENLHETIGVVSVETEKASVLRLQALDLERSVLEFAMWAGPKIPSKALLTANPVEYERQSKAFLDELRFTPGFAKLLAKEADLEATRARIENELSSIPEVSAKLLAFAEEKKHRELSESDLKLFRSAQYLASLRLTLRLIAAAKN